MNWTGKLFGGVFGLAFGGPVGLAIGAALGHLYDAGGLQGISDARADGAGAHAASAQAIAAQFFATTFETMGYVAKSDGRVSEQEIEAARSVMIEFRLDEAQRRAAIAHFTRGKSADFDPRSSIQRLRAACAGRPDLLRAFIEIQMRAAIAGTDLVGPSRQLLTRIAAMLGVGALELAHIEAVLRLRQGGYASGGRAGAGSDGDRAQRPLQPRRMRLEEAYQILEVDMRASDEDVVRAYRRQLSRHHPDKLKANGLPESMLEHAKQRTQQIIEAHERVREARGLS